MIRRELSPAMAGSVLLHGAAAAALLISWNFTRDLKVGAVVPVTIVANAPATDLKPALEAPVEQTAQVEEPLPLAPSDPAPAPQAAPLPPTPTPTPPKPAPSPAKPQPAPKVEKGLDFDALSASLSKMVKPSGGKPAAAPKGPTRPETATQARPDLGSGNAAAALNGLTEELQRRWNPNCDVDGGRDVVIRATFTIGAGGAVTGNVATEIRGAQNAVAQAAAGRARSAIYAASPFRNLPQDFYGQRIAVNFNAREACS